MKQEYLINLRSLEVFFEGLRTSNVLHSNLDAIELALILNKKAKKANYAIKIEKRILPDLGYSIDVLEDETPESLWLKFTKAEVELMQNPKYQTLQIELIKQLVG